MYQRIVVAVDLSDNSQCVLSRALAMLNDGGELRLLHVADAPVTGYARGIAKHHIANDIQVREACYPRIKALADAHGLAHNVIELRLGRPVDEICLAAAALNAELIVVGSHGHGGVRALLGDVANGVMHQASCDVLAIRVGAG